MATLDEIFAAMPEATAADDRDYLVIDPAARTISVPDTQRLFGVTGDELADRKYFICPRYVGDGLDLAGMFLTVYYRNAGGQADGYLVNDLQIQGDYVTFSWHLEKKVVLYKGTIGFSVCADLPNTNGCRRPDWNTTTASGEVLEGLHPDLGDVEGETSDVVTQLRAEVKAQTAAVEAAGAAQTEAVQNAATAATAEAQEQIQAKGTATLATIPADYSTLAGKVNNLANAVKGTAAGEIIRLDDVSPVEHYPAVKVRSKNLLNLDNYHLDSGGRYRIKVNGLETGKEYTVFSAVPMVFFKMSDSYTGHNSAALADTAGFTSFTFTMARNENTPADAQLYFFINNAEKTAMYDLDALKAMGLCIVEGDTATAYTPYVAPETVTLTRCSKNILGFTESFTKTMYGLTLSYDADNDIFTLDGTPTELGFSLAITEYTRKCNIVTGNEYTMTLEHLGGSVSVESDTNVMYLGTAETVDGPYKNWNAAKFPASGKKTNTKTANNAILYRAWVYIGAHDLPTFTGYKFRLQLEMGGEATEYEPNNGETFSPAEDGTVGGVTSLAPTMSLLTDASGVIVECEYNRDTGKVIQRLEAAIAALGGTI